MYDSKYDVVIVSGGFDPVHVGHIRMILEAASLGEMVVVGVNSDEWLARKKGYVFMPQEERLEIARSIKGVRFAMEFDDNDNSANDLIRKVRGLHPSASIAFANGGDRTKENIPEIHTAKESHVELVWGIGGNKIQSSSDLVSAANKNKGE